MGTLSGELKQQVLNNRRAQAIVCTKAGRKVIVVGCMASNLPPNLRDHPLIDFWYGDNGLSHYHVPETAGMLIHTRFVQHKDVVRLKEEAHRKGVEFYPQPFTTGDLREILEPLAIVPPKLTEYSRLVDHSVVLASVPQAIVAEALAATPIGEEHSMAAGNGAVPSVTPRGALKAFVHAHAQFDGVASDVAEANRLMTLARAPEHKATVGGITRGSLLVTYRTMRRANGLPARRIGNFTGRRRAGQRDGALTPIGAAKASSAIDDVVSLFDDAVLSMQNGVAAVQLAKERYLRLVDSQKSTGDVKKILAELAARL